MEECRLEMEPQTEARKCDSEDPSDYQESPEHVYRGAGLVQQMDVDEMSSEDDEYDPRI